MKNILVAKGARSIKLDPTRWNHMPIYDWIGMLAALAACNPDVTFWCTCNIDFKQSDLEIGKVLFPHGNVRWPDKKYSGTNQPWEFMGQYIEWLDRHNVKPDGGIFDVGTASKINLPFYVPIQQEEKADKKPSKLPQLVRKGFCCPSMIAWFMSAPLLHMMNELGPDFPWISIHVDPRCNLLQKDLRVLPKKSLGQRTYTYPAPRWTPEKSFHKVNLTVDYAPIHMAGAFGYYPESAGGVMSKKKTLLGMGINGLPGTNGAQQRWKTLKAALDAGADCEVYGKWEPQDVHPDHQYLLSDPRMKGPIPKFELDEKMKEWATTLLSATGRGWVTPKLYECLFAGVTPIFMPDYDDQKNVYWPDELRMKSTSADEVKRGIDFLQSDVGLILSLRERYITQELLDGTALNQVVMQALDESYVGPKRNPISDGIMERVKSMVSDKTGSMDEF